MAEDSNKKKQPPKPDQSQENGEEKSYTVYIFAGWRTDEQVEELAKLIEELLRQANNLGPEN